MQVHNLYVDGIFIAFHSTCMLFCHKCDLKPLFCPSLRQRPYIECVRAVKGMTRCCENARMDKLVSLLRCSHMEYVPKSVGGFNYKSILSKIEDKNQKLIQSSTTLDPGYQWESDNFTIRHHKREPRGQPFPSR